MTKIREYALVRPDGSVRDVFKARDVADYYKSIFDEEDILDIVPYTFKIRYEEFLADIDNLQGDWYLERHLFGILHLPIKITKKTRCKFLLFLTTKAIY